MLLPFIEEQQQDYWKHLSKQGILVENLDQSIIDQDPKKDVSLFNEDRNNVYVPSIEVNSIKINVFNNHIYMLEVFTFDFIHVQYVSKLWMEFVKLKKSSVKFQLSKEGN